MKKLSALFEFAAEATAMEEPRQDMTTAIVALLVTQKWAHLTVRPSAIEEAKNFDLELKKQPNGTMVFTATPRARAATATQPAPYSQIRAEVSSRVVKEVFGA